MTVKALFMSRTLIIIPAFNEAPALGRVLASLPKKNSFSLCDVVVIDDGSTDATSTIAKSKNVKVIKHLINRGLGAVLATGFAYARKKNYDFVITFDADGQHKAIDIPKILKPLYLNKADVVIGSRLLNQTSMPFIRKIVNYFSNIFTYILFGIWTTDSQSGLRAFNKKAFSSINIKTQRMEVSSEIFKEIQKNKLYLTEISVQSIYTKYSLNKGQKISNAPNVIWKLLLHRFS